MGVFNTLLSFSFLFIQWTAASDHVGSVVNRVYHFFSPPAEDVTMTQAMCRGTAAPKLFADKNSLFVQARSSAGSVCPRTDKGEMARADFLNPSQSDCQNTVWVDGSLDASGKQCVPEDGPSSWTNVPAILGFGDPINKACGYAGSDKAADDLGKCCMKKGKYYHRLFMGKTKEGLYKWSMCQNLKWVLCAAQGFLLGQAKGSKGGKIFFPNAEPIPSKKSFAPTESPTAGVATQFKLKSSDNGASVGVTVHEFCLLDQVCSNAASLWSLPKNSIFECEYNSGWARVSGEVEHSDELRVSVDESAISAKAFTIAYHHLSKFGFFFVFMVVVLVTYRRCVKPSWDNFDSYHPLVDGADDL